MADSARPLRMVVVTLDAHLSGVLDSAGAAVARDLPGFELAVHMASRWSNDPAAAEAANADIARADIVVAHMLFLEDHYLPVIEALKARREECLAMMGCLSAGEIVKLTKLGKFRMDKEAGGALAILKRMRGKAKGPETAGARQMALLRRLPKLLRFIPGTAQDVRAYFLGMGYLLAGSAENMEGLIRHLVGRYAPDHAVGGAAEPVHYPDVGVYHPRLAGRIAEDADALPRMPVATGRVGLLLMRSYVLANDTGHYDGVIAALEAQGLDVVPAFASGLDSRPAVTAYFQRDGAARVDAIVSLTGFSLVGGPAYNDAGAAVDMLTALDVPYIACQATEFQTIEGWRKSAQGLTPVETVMMVALPELDGASVPMTIGGRVERGRGDGGRRRARRHARAPRREAGRAAPDAGRRPADRDHDLQFPAQCRRDGYGGVSVGLRLAVERAEGPRGGGAFGRPARERSCDDRDDPDRQRRAPRHARQRLCAGPGRRSCPPRTTSARHRGAMGPLTRSASGQRTRDPPARRALRQRPGRRPARDGL